MRIMICDDQQSDLERIAVLCKTYATERGLSVCIQKENDPQHLHVEDIDVLVLDIRMPGVSGIEIQRRLEFCVTKPLVIFVTNYAEYSMESHGVNVIGFLEKPIQKDDLYRYLDKARMLLKTGKVVMFGEGGYYNTKHISYIFMDQGISKAVLENGQETVGVFKTMKQWEDELRDYGFIRINKSCLINCQYVNDIRDGCVTLKNEEQLAISRRERKHCEEAYGEYLALHARFI